MGRPLATLVGMLCIILPLSFGQGRSTTLAGYATSKGRLQDVEGYEDGSYALEWFIQLTAPTNSVTVYVPEPSETVTGEASRWTVESHVELEYSTDDRKSWLTPLSRIEQPAYSELWKPPLGDGRFLRCDFVGHANSPFKFWLRYRLVQHIKTLVDSVQAVARPQPAAGSMARYLAPDTLCDFTDARVQAVVGDLRKTVAGRCDSLVRMAELTLERLSRYPYRSNRTPKPASAVWGCWPQMRDGHERDSCLLGIDCKEAANAACAIFRALDIPARVVITAAREDDRWCSRDGACRALHALVEYHNGMEWVLNEPHCTIHFADSQVRLMADSRLDRLYGVYYPSGEVRMDEENEVIVQVKRLDAETHWEAPSEVPGSRGDGLWLRRQAPCGGTADCHPTRD